MSDAIIQTDASIQRDASGLWAVEPSFKEDDFNGSGHMIGDQ